MAKAPFRPYDPPMAKEICDLLGCNPVAIEDVLAMDARFPDRSTFFKWKNSNADLNDLYIKSKQDQIECLLNEVNRRVLDDSKDLIEQPDGKLTPNSARIGRDQLIMRTMTWQACRLMPRLYGDKTIIEQTNKNVLTLQDKADIAEIRKAYVKPE